MLHCVLFLHAHSNTFEYVYLNVAQVVCLYDNMSFVWMNRYGNNELTQYDIETKIKRQATVN